MRLNTKFQLTHLLQKSHCSSLKTLPRSSLSLTSTIMLSNLLLAEQSNAFIITTYYNNLSCKGWQLKSS